MQRFLKLPSTERLARDIERLCGWKINELSPFVVLQFTTIN